MGKPVAGDEGGAEGGISGNDFFPVILPEIRPVVEMATVRRRVNELLSPPSEDERCEMDLGGGHGNPWVELHMVYYKNGCIVACPYE